MIAEMHEKMPTWGVADDSEKLLTQVANTRYALCWSCALLALGPDNVMIQLGQVFQFMHLQNDLLCVILFLSFPAACYLAFAYEPMSPNE